MKLTATEELGLRCLLQVARLQDDRPRGGAPIGAIAKQEKLSEANVAKLMKVLRVGGMVEVIPGRGGGYRLKRPADQISVWEALRALAPPLFCEEFCDRFSGTGTCCVHEADCAIREVWQVIDEIVERTLSRVSVADLLQGEQVVRVLLRSA